MLVRDAVDDYLDECKTLQPDTQQWYSQKLKVFVDWCEQQGQSLEGLNNRVVVKFVEHLKTIKSPRRDGPISTYTISGYIQVVKSFLMWCSNDEEYEQAVSDRTARRVKKPTVDKTIIETFTDEHLDALREACKKEYNEYLVARDLVIVELFLHTGIRSGELCGLTIENVFLDPKDPYIKVFGKRRKWREVGLDGKIRRVVQGFIRKYRSDAPKTDRLFISRAGDPLTPNGMVQLFERLGQWAGIEGVRCSPHTFRHTFAIRFIQAGGDVFVLSRLLGHGSIAITQKYLEAFTQRDARRRQLN